MVTDGYRASVRPRDDERKRGRAERGEILTVAVGRGFYSLLFEIA